MMEPNSSVNPAKTKGYPFSVKCKIQISGHITSFIHDHCETVFPIGTFQGWSKSTSTLPAIALLVKAQDDGHASRSLLEILRIPHRIQKRVRQIFSV
jgi:hypothetical protein